MQFTVFTCRNAKWDDEDEAWTLGERTEIGRFDAPYPMAAAGVAAELYGLTTGRGGTAWIQSSEAVCGWIGDGGLVHVVDIAEQS